MHSQASHETVLPRTTRKALPAARPRLRGAIIATACWAVLVLSWFLTPRAAGHGTHEQLGLPPCSFLVRTGYPCPSCGLTTSIAAMSHAQFLAAFEAQPFGVILFAAILFFAVAATVQWLTGHDVISALRPRTWWAFAALGGMLAGWGLKVAIGLATGRLPVR